MALTFYYGSGSPFAWKVWLALEHKAIPYDLKVLSFDKGETRAPAFRAINPRGKVPTIVDEGYALWESTVILEYLDEVYPERPLLPKDLQGRATVRRIAAEAENFLGPLIGNLVGATLFRKGPEDGVVTLSNCSRVKIAGKKFSCRGCHGLPYAHRFAAKPPQCLSGN